MTEFVSKLEEILEAEELLFDPTPGFGPYRSVMPEEAVAHPAKMNTKMLAFLIEKFTLPGDVVLDPMAGTGSTGVVAALHGRNAVCVELEEKFYNWMEKARRNVEKHPTLTPKGRIVNIRGDARKLSELLKNVTDVIITSPPYSNGFRYNPQNAEKRIKRLIEVEKEAVRRGRKWAVSSEEVIRRRYAQQDLGYGKSKNNIGNLPHGRIDAVITSPPYEGTLSRKQGAGIVRREGVAKNDGSTVTRNLLPVKYSKSRRNIGNLEKETYLEAMLKVYDEMWKVLKPGGLAVVVVKPFVRNKRVVDLPYQTWLLLERVGFELVKLYKLRLKNVSFWRILFEKKYPSVPKLRHEYVIVARKAVK